VPEEKRDSAKSEGRSRLGGLPTSAVVVIVIALVVLVWLLFLRGDDEESDTETAANGTQAEKTVEVVSEEELSNAVADVGYPVYWLGPRAGVQYEVTKIDDGRTYVRYLPEGEKPETKKPFLTVANYEQDNAFQVLEELGTETNQETFEVDGGGRGLERADTDTGLYVAFPGDNTQIEVFDPEPGQARELVESGAVVPVG
jgi:hypothetical protein